MPGGAHENMKGWTPEEDEMLLQLIETSGKRWKLIAEALDRNNPRTPAMVRNRYLRIERGRWLTEQGMSKNRCGQCGELKRGHVCKVPRAMVTTNLASQEARHQQARDAMGAPLTPSSVRSDSGQTTLALGGATALTMPLGHGERPAADADNASILSSPGPLSLGANLGLSPLGTSTPGGGLSLSGFAGLPSLGGVGGPPSLRAQNSMDILLQASDLHRTRVTAGDSEAPTPLPSTFDSNPFKLPTVTSAELPVEIRDGGGAGKAEPVGQTVLPLEEIRQDICAPVAAH